MLDFSENGSIDFKQEDLELIEQLERDEQIIKAVQRILQERKQR